MPKKRLVIKDEVIPREVLEDFDKASDFIRKGKTKLWYLGFKHKKDKYKVISIEKRLDGIIGEINDLKARIRKDI